MSILIPSLHSSHFLSPLPPNPHVTPHTHPHKVTSILCIATIAHIARPVSTDSYKEIVENVGDHLSDCGDCQKKGYTTTTTTTTTTDRRWGVANSVRIRQNRGHVKEDDIAKDDEGNDGGGDGVGDNGDTEDNDGTTMSTTTTTTIFDPGNVDCVEEEDECTVACQRASDRNYAVRVLQELNGKVCSGPSDCQPGEGACPATTTTTTTITTTTTCRPCNSGIGAIPVCSSVDEQLYNHPCKLQKCVGGPGGGHRSATIAEWRREQCIKTTTGTSTTFTTTSLTTTTTTAGPSAPFFPHDRSHCYAGEFYSGPYSVWPRGIRMKAYCKQCPASEYQNSGYHQTTSCMAKRDGGRCEKDTKWQLDLTSPWSCTACEVGKHLPMANHQQPLCVDIPTTTSTTTTTTTTSTESSTTVTSPSSTVAATAESTTAAAAAAATTPQIIQHLPEWVSEPAGVAAVDTSVDAAGFGSDGASIDGGLSGPESGTMSGGAIAGAATSGVLLILLIAFFTAWKKERGERRIAMGLAADRDRAATVATNNAFNMNALSATPAASPAATRAAALLSELSSQANGPVQYIVPVENGSNEVRGA